MNIYLDFETAIGPSLSLGEMSLRSYLAATRITSYAYAIDDGPVVCKLAGDADFMAQLGTLTYLAAGGNTVVAHNASFDVRVLTVMLKRPWPATVHCTMEMAHAWAPNQPGGYSLDNLARCWLPTTMQKQKIDLTNCTDDELRAYNAQDVVVCRALHKLALAKMPAAEIRVHELTQNVKELTFDIDAQAAADAVEAFAAQAATSAADASRLLGDDDGFNFDGADVRSVKPHAVKHLLLDRLGFEATTISKKKLNPEKLRGNQTAAQVIDAVAHANKALAHKRRVRAFHGMDTVDCELTYFAAHTGRWSSRNAGKGLNLHNLPKRNPAIAKPVRSLFRLPDDLCFVRGDFANVEYRVLGLLAGSEHVAKLFAADPLADPYAQFWTAATGQKIDKKNKADVPKRQLAKAAVLGLGYLMGVARWTEELVRGVADPEFRVTLADLDALCTANKWGMPVSPQAKAAQTKLRCPWQVATVAEKTRAAFHDVHPEFGRLARWLELATARISAAADPFRALAWAEAQPNAPDPSVLRLTVDTTMQGISVRAICGPGWTTPTVTWRDLAIRTTPMGAGLTFVRAGNRPPARASANVLIENVTQSASRNALAMGLLELDRRGYPYVLHVHDEVMLVVPRRIPEILAAKQAMLDVFGPGGWLSSQGWSWAALIKPGDVGVSATLYEDEHFNEAAWPRLLAGDASILTELP